MVPLHKIINQTNHLLYKYTAELIVWLNIYAISCKVKDTGAKESSLKKFEEAWENIDKILI